MSIDNSALPFIKMVVHQAKASHLTMHNMEINLKCVVLCMDKILTFIIINQYIFFPTENDDASSIQTPLLGSFLLF
jgi:hypothetical protein